MGLEEDYPGYPWPGHNFTGGNTIIVGDSHTWFAGGGTQYPRWDTDSSPGRSSNPAYAILSQWLRSRHERVCFDIATNDVDDPATLRMNLRRVLDLIGKQRKLILVTSYRPDNGSAAVNRVIRDFASGRPRVSICNWLGQVNAHPEYIADEPGEGIWPDGIHFTPAGYEARTSLVKEAIRDA